MYIGIEIGGTKLQLGLGPADGTLSALWRGTVDLAAGGEGIRRAILAAVPELLAQGGVPPGEVRGVGVGFGGPVDDATASVVTSHQVHGWDGFPLAAWLSGALGLPVALGNDADAAALGEALYGAGQGRDPLFYMTVGSGIGGGLVVGGKIVRGTGRGAAEVGHLRIPDVTGVTRPLETLASGWGVGERARRATGRATVTAADVGAAASAGEPWAVALMGETCGYLAEGLCSVIALVCPRRIVVGGGVSLSGDAFFEPLRRAVAERVFRPFAGLTDIVPAELGEAVVVHGALALARQADFMASSSES